MHRQQHATFRRMLPALLHYAVGIATLQLRMKFKVPSLASANQSQQKLILSSPVTLFGWLRITLTLVLLECQPVSSTIYMYPVCGGCGQTGACYTYR